MDNAVLAIIVAGIVAIATNSFLILRKLIEIKYEIRKLNRREDE